MKTNISANAPMRLKGSRNTRDLGGYPTLDGRNTINGVFLRSDKPSHWTERDQEILYRYGVRLVLDLRSVGEAERDPCVLHGYRDVQYANIQLLDNIQSDPTKSHMPATLGEMYVGLLENSKAALLNVFRAMLRHDNSCILFNCTGGKDRTGIVAMLLLKTAGVPDDIVVADYAATYFNIQADMEKLMQASPIEIPLYLMKSDPENMQMALSHIAGHYGTVQNYLLDIGLEPEGLNALRNRLLGI